LPGTTLVKLQAMGKLPAMGNLQVTTNSQALENLRERVMRSRWPQVTH
jgi:hypothetical protein